MNINDVFKKYDPKSQADWRDYKGLKFLITPMGNPTQKKEVLKTFTLKEAMGLEAEGPTALGDVKAEAAISRMYELYSRVLVIDWDEVKDEDKVLKFSAKKVHEWMVDDDEFANWVIQQSTDIRDKLAAKVEEIEKN